MTRRSEKEIEALTVDLSELARHAPARLGQCVAELSIREQADLALRLPARERLQLLLHAPRPMRLVRALPDSEFYLTVREIGPTDALPLVSLGSAEQIHHLLDLEAWQRDRFDSERAGAWVALVLESGEPAIRRLLRSSDDELLALLFQSWIRIQSIEPDDRGAPEPGDEHDLVSPDGFHRFAPKHHEHRAVVRRVTAIFFADEPERYSRIVWTARTELPSSLEEEALRWRQSRLEEHGFPPWEEALSIYEPPAGLSVHPEPPRPSDPDGLAAPRGALRLPAVRDRLGEALAGLAEETRERVLHELVSLANHLLVADRADTREPAAHDSALEKGVGYVHVALQARRVEDPAELCRLLTEIPLIELFREGYARAVELGERARAISRAGWGATHPRALEMLDSPVRDRILALAETRPLYFEIEQDREDRRGFLRPFRSLAELEESRVALEIAELVGRLLLSDMQLDLEGLIRDRGHPETNPPRFSCLMLTLLAWHAVREALTNRPLPVTVAADFLRNVASRRTAAPDAPLRALEALIETLDRTFHLTPRESFVLRGFGRACLELLAAECSSLDPGVPLGAARIRCLLIE